MIQKTRAIVLHQIKYTDTGRIMHLYTESFGRLSVIARISRSKKSVSQAALFQPLSFIESEIYYRAGRELHHLKEAKSLLVYHSIPYQIRKNSIALFLSEILYKTLKEEEENASLFHFLHHALQFFDGSTDEVPAFHLWFLMQFSRFLGFYPENNYSEEDCYFDLQNGVFTGEPPQHKQFVRPGPSLLISELLRPGVPGELAVNRDPDARKEILGYILAYYQLHVEGFGQLRSLPVLTSIFH